MNRFTERPTYYRRISLDDVTDPYGRAGRFVFAISSWSGRLASTFESRYDTVWRLVGRLTILDPYSDGSETASRLKLLAQQMYHIHIINTVHSPLQ